MPSPPVLKTVLHSGDVFFDSDKSLSFITAIVSAICFYSSNIIISKYFEYLIFYSGVSY